LVYFARTGGVWIGSWFACIRYCCSSLMMATVDGRNM
jgi:hypothetical protein